MVREVQDFKFRIRMTKERTGFEQFWETFKLGFGTTVCEM
jgi:hypothetical protein